MKEKQESKFNLTVSAEINSRKYFLEINGRWGFIVVVIALVIRLLVLIFQKGSS